MMWEEDPILLVQVPFPSVQVPFHLVQVAALELDAERDRVALQLAYPASDHMAGLE